MGNEATNWLRRAKRLTESVPEGMEAVFDGCAITLYPRGTLVAHMKDQVTRAVEAEDFGTTIVDYRSRFIAYTEGA